VSSEKRNIPIVRHPVSAQLKKHSSFFFDKHDFGNHGNLFAQELPKLTLLWQGTEKLPRPALKTRNSDVAIKIQADDFFKKQGFSVEH
jgi:hypothetical protein